MVRRVGIAGIAPKRLWWCCCCSHGRDTTTELRVVDGQGDQFDGFDGFGFLSKSKGLKLKAALVTMRHGCKTAVKQDSTVNNDFPS